MRELTFKSYLKNYVKETSQCKSLDVSKLAQEAATANPALYEPLALYCALCEKNSALQKAVSKTPNFDRTYILTTMTEKDLTNKRVAVPDSYKKIYAEYMAQKVENKISHEYKEKMRKEILQKNKQLKFSIRKLSLAVNIDPSNLNAFLKKKEYSKVSPDKLEALVTFLKEQ